MSALFPGAMTQVLLALIGTLVPLATVVASIYGVRHGAPPDVASQSVMARGRPDSIGAAPRDYGG